MRNPPRFPLGPDDDREAERHDALMEELEDSLAPAVFGAFYDGRLSHTPDDLPEVETYGEPTYRVAEQMAPYIEDDFVDHVMDVASGNNAEDELLARRTLDWAYGRAICPTDDEIIEYTQNLKLGNQ